MFSLSSKVLTLQHASFKIYVIPFCFVLFNCFCFLLLNSTAITICPLTAVSKLSEIETNCVCASFAGLLFCPAICATYKEICLVTYIVAEICSFLSSACYRPIHLDRLDAELRLRLPVPLYRHNYNYSNCYSIQIYFRL